MFYNCGEDKFNYLVSKHYDGPNYYLMPRQIENKFFYIENQLIWSTFEHPFNFTNCRRNFMFPMRMTDNTADWYKNLHMVPVLMLCVDFKNKVLKSYQLRNEHEEGQ